MLGKEEDAAPAVWKLTRGEGKAVTARCGEPEESQRQFFKSTLEAPGGQKELGRKGSLNELFKNKSERRGRMEAIIAARKTKGTGSTFAGPPPEIPGREARALGRKESLAGIQWSRASCFCCRAWT